jgi:ACR3 family arsenite efflux pump ArsB
VGQSTAALARVLGPLIAVPLFFRSPELPYCTAAAIMVMATVVFVLFARHGVDHAAHASDVLPASIEL